MRIRFLTSTPLDISRGSGTYVGIQVLARALRNLGHTVDFETPRHQLPIYTLQRLAFNRALRPSAEFELTVGFDMDGYRIAGGSTAHVASLKGVIADELRFESGVTRFSMSMQARRERLHVQRATRVLVTSRYSGERAQEYYSLARCPVVVPELIDLGEWRSILQQARLQQARLQQQAAVSGRFTVLFVGRLYRRKRVDVLLRAAAALRERIPGIEIRIVGNGPCGPMLHRLSRDLQVGGSVVWLGDISRAELAGEYNRCDIFCLPSVQEGFGIVLLEAMAASKPIVASRSAGIPEVVPQGMLVEAGNEAALADAIQALYESPDTRAQLARTGDLWVEQFDAPLVARVFLEASAGVERERTTCR